LPPAPPPPPVFQVNRGADVLAQQQVSLPDDAAEGSASDWIGRWRGTQTLLTGDLQGTLPVDMNVTRQRDGTLRLTQSAFGITVIQGLVPSPEQPGHLAAGTSVDRHSAGPVSFSSRTELTAIRSGNHLTIGMYVTRVDPGTYNGQPLPTPPPSTSLLVLDR
jgi:hypothetical protein